MLSHFLMIFVYNNKQSPCVRCNMRISSHHTKLVLSTLLYACFKRYIDKSNDMHLHILRSGYALNRRRKERISWDTLNTKISDMHFRRMFRMDRSTFNKLCNAISAAVGEAEFKSESYINLFLNNRYPGCGKEVSIFHAQKAATGGGGYIPGEVKVAIALRLLAGGCHFDLAVIFDVSPNHCKVIFTQVLRDWIIKPNLGKINMEAYLRDITTMKVVSNGFARRSNGLLQGAIGAIDG